MRKCYQNVYQVLSSVPRLLYNTFNRYLLAKLTLICMNFLAGYF